MFDSTIWPRFTVLKACSKLFSRIEAKPPPVAVAVAVLDGERESGRPERESERPERDGLAMTLASSTPISNTSTLLGCSQKHS